MAWNIAGHRWTAYSVLGASVYFGLFGLKTGIVLLLSAGSFLTGKRRECSIGTTSCITVCLFLSVCFTSPAFATPDCSKVKSKEARSIISKVLNPLYMMKNYDMPTGCVFSPTNDRYATIELSKRKLGSKWMCSTCGKSYDKEEDLEKHYVLSHEPKHVDGCLADYCDVLRCDAFHVIKDVDVCNDTHMAKTKKQCMGLMKDCAPSYLDVTRKVNFETMLQASVCSYLSCDHYWDIPADERPDYRYYYLTYVALFFVLVVFLMVYCKMASYNIERSHSIEEILATADQYERPKPAIIPPTGQDMEMRQRSGKITSEWHERE